jgi:hypothetical protein
VTAGAIGGHQDAKKAGLEVEARKYSLERIQNGDWDIDTDCISSRNQGPC